MAASLVGVSFGVLAEPIMGAVAAIAMSAIVFASAAQFGAIAVLAAGGGAAPAIAAGILLNLRFLPMGVAMAPSVRGGPAARAAQGLAIVDASWALGNRGGGRFAPAVVVGATLPQYPLWVAGTAVGALGGDLIGDPAALGLDAVFPAFFLGLLVEELRAGAPARAAALSGAAIALVLMPVTPAGIPVLAASAAAVLALFGRERA